MELEKEIPTREEVEKKLDEEIAEVERVTEINFKTGEPNESEMSLNWEVPWTGKKATTKQLSIIEAHEKGHRIRRFHTLTEKLRKGFDMSKAVYTNEMYEYSKKKLKNKDEEYVDAEREITYEESKEEFLEHYLFSGDELAERMSQLKNYFGFSASEVFTKEHLDYARQHYIEDTKMDNSMSLFFQAITPETEDAFLEIINKYGI